MPWNFRATRVGSIAVCVVCSAADASIPAARKAVVAALIHKESQRLSGIVGTFLDVERISAGVLRLERKPTDLSIVASEAIERAGLLADRKHIRIETNLPPVAISGDAELLGFAPSTTC